MKINIILYAILIFVVGCADTSSGNITFFVPEHAQGVFYVKEDRTSENAPKLASGGAIEISIPKGGIVRFNSISFLYKWNRINVLAADKIPFFSSYDDTLKDDAFGCWFLFSTPDSAYYYLGSYRNKKHIDSLTVAELQNHLLK